MQQFIKIIIIIILSSCGDDGPNCPGDMILPIEISPYKFFYTIGDTITISSKFHKLIFDKKTDKFNDASLIRFSPFISLSQIDSSFIDNYSRIKDFCEILEKTSDNFKTIQLSKESVLVGEYILNKDSLFFIASLKLKAKGFFWINLQSLSSGDSYSQGNHQFNCRGRIIEFNLSFPSVNNIQFFNIFNSDETNRRIIMDSSSVFLNHAGYCFEVR